MHWNVYSRAEDLHICDRMLEQRTSEAHTVEADLQDEAAVCGVMARASMDRAIVGISRSCCSQVALQEKDLDSAAFA